jgi:hypothetical protein
VVVLDRVPDVNSGMFQLQAAVRPAGGVFGGLEQVSGAQEGSNDQLFDAAAAAAPAGRELVLWPGADTFGARNVRLHLSERDATPRTARL